MASNQIVQVQISQTAAPTPETLQRTGAMVSTGATILAPGTSGILTQLSDLTLLLRGAANLTSLSWSGGLAQGSTTLPHGFPIGESIELTIAGVTPAAYNGNPLALITGPSTFTYPLSSNPGTASVPGGYTVADVNELVAMATTFFAQGSNTAVYVLELGPLDVNDAITALAAYITANPNSAYTPGSSGFYYAYLIPREWDGNTNLLAMIAQYEALNAKTYFFVTTTLSTYRAYNDLMKDVVSEIETPAMGTYPQAQLVSLVWTAGSGGTTAYATGSTSVAHGIQPGQWFQLQGNVPVGYNGWWMAQPGTVGQIVVFDLAANPGAVTTLGFLAQNIATSPGVLPNEFQLAAGFYDLLTMNPSSSNRATPFSFDFQFGVTPWPQQGLNALQLTLKQAAVNIIRTGAEGGISTAAWYWGTTMDGRGLLYWYSVDWVAINGQVNVANEVINGSNNPLSPLYYDQPGINRLQDRLVQTVNSAVSFGLANGTVVATSLTGTQLGAAIAAGQFAGQIVVNAVPFLPYLTASPGDYKTGTYNGLSILYVAQQGFISIQIDIDVTDFAAAQ